MPLQLYGEEITGMKLFGQPLYEFIEDDDYDQKRSELIRAKVKIYGYCTCEEGLMAITDDDDIEYCGDCGRPLAEGEIRMMGMSQGIAKTISRPVKKPGRNDPCTCGSGKKSKKCCYPKI